MIGRPLSDPLAEAKEYLAYGRQEQAAKILEQAIRKQPSRSDCRLLLQEIRSGVHPPPRRRTPELSLEAEAEAAYQESMELKATGESDEVIAAHLEARLQGLTKRLDEEDAREIERIKANYSAPKRLVLPIRLRILVGVAALVVLAGGGLEETLGTRFIFAAANQYREAMPWIVAALTPLFAWLMIRVERINHDLATRYPTWWIRWLIMFPLTAILLSAAVALAPLGWSALFGRLNGSDARPIDAQVRYVFKPSSRGCRQEAEVQVGDNWARICIANVLVGRVPRDGETVTVVGSVSRFGTRIKEIQTR
jgi:hypothetical protein